MVAIYRVREPFAFDQPNGVQRVMRPGDLVGEDDPAYKGKEHLYEAVEAAAARAVESATAAPGERRVLSRGKKAAAKKAAARKAAAPSESKDSGAKGDGGDQGDGQGDAGDGQPPAGDDDKKE
jgi:hypothetical protein